MSAVLSRKDHKVQWLRVGDLVIEWREAQRALHERKVDSIIRDFDPDALGVLAVAELNGSKGVRYHLIDGQHRREAVQRMYGDKERVPCEVITGCETAQEAARIWLGRNTHQTKPTAMERFQRQVVAGIEEAVAVDKVIRQSGFKVASNGIQAVSSCASAYRRYGPHGLRWALDAIKATWGHDPKGVAGDIIRGYVALYGHFGPQIDIDRLASAVSKRYTPAALIGAARGGRAVLAGGMQESVLRILVRAYNYNLPESNRLVLAD